jgi:O-antigen/teichoic acid export membrane protein
VSGPPIPPPEESPAPGGHLDSIRSGVAWNAGFRIFRDVVQFGLTALLARLLAPEVYGQFALITSVTIFLGVLSFEHVAQHLLVVRDEEVNYQDHFTASVVIQGALFLVTNAVAWGVRNLPGYEEVAFPLHIMSITFLLNGPSTLRTMMLQRAMDWRRQRTLEAVSLVAASLAIVGMALAGAGVLALLVPGMIKDLVFWWDLFVAAKWRPAWTWDARRYRSSISFAAARIGSGAFTHFRNVVENGFLTERLGFGTLGIVNRATAFPQVATMRPTGLLVQTVFPVFGRIQGETEKVRRLSGMLLQTVVWAALPLGIACALAARPGILLLYGGQWTEAIPLVPFTLATCLAVVVKQVLYSILLSGGRERVCTILDAALLGGTVLLLLLLVPRGLPVYLAGSAALQVLLMVFAVGSAVAVGRLDRADVRAALLPPLCGSAAGLAVVIPALGAAEALGPTGSALAAAAAFLAVHAVAVRLLFPADLERLLRLSPRADLVLRMALLGRKRAS